MEYNYNVIDDFSDQVDVSILNKNIKESPISGKFDGIVTNRDVVKILFSEDLTSEEENILNTLISGYTYINYDTSSSIVLSDMKPNATRGGTFPKDTWVTRELNCISHVVNWCELSSNQVKLSPGRYMISCECPAYGVKTHQAIFKNITSDTVVLTGTSAYSGDNSKLGDMLSITKIEGAITVSESSLFEVQHMCEKTKLDCGLGIPAGFGVPETYTILKINNI